MTQGAQYIVHITKAGERWDLLAWRYYGDPTDYQIIIMANPGVAIGPVFEVGISLAVPIVQKSALVSVDLPPWKLPHPVGI
jgi:phage tail protein X